MSGNVLIDKEWFFERLQSNGKSVRGLAKHMNVDASAVSRMFAGQRRMKMQEAGEIALFLGVHVNEVLKHAGVAVDLDGNPTKVLLAATIDEDGKVQKLIEPKPLPQNLIDRAQSAVKGYDGQIIAAQIRAATGPLSLWDDAVILFHYTDTVEPSAIGALSICRLLSGDQIIARLERARKTGEALIRCPSEQTREVTLITATPIIVILP